jgi:hypothetical protein
MRIFADLGPPQTFALRADEILGNERQTVWSAATVASACNSISPGDHAAYAANMPGRAARPPPLHAQGPRLAPSKGTRLRNMWGPILIIKGLRVDGREHRVHLSWDECSAAIKVRAIWQAAHRFYGNQDAIAQRSSPVLASNRANRHTVEHAAAAPAGENDASVTIRPVILTPASKG